jgi:hypothetical protein
MTCDVVCRLRFAGRARGGGKRRARPYGSGARSRSVRRCPQMARDLFTSDDELDEFLAHTYADRQAARSPLPTGTQWTRGEAADGSSLRR